MTPDRPAPTPLRLVARALAGAAALLVALASPAAADPAGPSDFRSEVLAITPEVAGVEAEIKGGDSFLELRVAEGRTVEVPGYQDEPYLRFLPDGTVERNRLSTTTYTNEDRDGIVDIPAEATEATASGADPEWERVASGGSYAWHDHRVHWMGKATPPVPRGELVTGQYDPWRVPIVVDGEPVEITGQLRYEESVSPLPWVALAVVVGAGLVVAGRRAGLRAAAAALLTASVLGAVTGRAEWAATPDGSGNPLLWALPAFAVVAAAAAVALATRPAGVVAALAAVAALSGWVLFRIQVVLKPVLPTELPDALDRASLALGLGASVAVAVLAVTSGAIALPALDEDDD